MVVGPFALALPPAILGLAWWLTREVDVATVPGSVSAGFPTLDEIRHQPEAFGDFDPGPVVSEGLGVLVFEYADVNGVVTERVLSPWIEYPGHIRGYCSTAAGLRTFRKDRVLAWSLGRDALKRP